MSTFGFIGTGNMGGALARAAAKSLPGENILLSNRTAEKAAMLAAELGCRAVDNAAVAAEADFIFLGVKPQMMEGMLTSIRPVLAERKSRFVLVTMAAGLTMERIRAMAGVECPVIRIMPNTPCAIGEGILLYACDGSVTPEEEAEFLSAMSAAGRVAPLAEHLINAGSTISGSAPAFAAMFMEALADGAVACGLPRAAAMEYAAQMLVGTAKLYLESGQHPGAMKDAVCSPGGSTIQGVRALEAGGFRSAVTEAIIATYEKNVALG